VIDGDALSMLSGKPAPFDIVFLDPPFGGDLWNASAERLESRGWLSEDAWIYVESPAEADLALPANWMLHRESQAGAVRFALYRRAAADPVK
jgi:16S rRNA (guanine966-N2)-methyltransferase